jgi:hypothetical protein
VAGLGENHKRRILATFQYADELLSQSLSARATAQTDLQSRGVQDFTPSELLRVESDMERIRQQMRSFLERFQIALPGRSTPSRWILKTNLTSLDLALEELYPRKMRGYGEMGSAAASELERTLQEIRKLVSQLLESLE